MYSMGPIVRRGYAAWDRGLFPVDEFTERLKHVRERMAAEGLDGLVVLGNMFDDADLAYLVGGHLDGAVLIAAEGEPIFVSAGGSRELYFHKTLTWLENIGIAGPAGLAAAIAKTLRELSVTGGTVGIVGRQILTGRVNAELDQALAAWNLCECDALLADIRRAAREREVLAVRIALSIATSAVEAGEAAFAKGASNAEALVEAERAARLRRAWDVRLLSNIESPDLRPYEGHSSERREPFVLWAAARYQGYWAEAANAGADPDGAAGAALSAMLETVRAGESAGVVAEAATGALGETSETALAYGLGGSIGQTFSGPADIRPGSTERLRGGELLTLRAVSKRGDTLSLASALVRVGDAGCEAGAISSLLGALVMPWAGDGA